ncbi:MAG: twin-arginine translocase subunit TatC, partial [Elusimicrobia bacterium CG_4_10_14_0_2_um_filter_56_8]
MDPVLPLPSHLDELRRRLLYSLAFFACAFGLSFNYSSLLFKVI